MQRKGWGLSQLLHSLVSTREELGRLLALSWPRPGPVLVPVLSSGSEAKLLMKD